MYESNTYNFLIGRSAIKRDLDDKPGGQPHKINAVQFYNGQWLLLVIAPTGELRTWFASESTVLEQPAVKFTPQPRLPL